MLLRWKRSPFSCFSTRSSSLGIFQSCLSRSSACLSSDFWPSCTLHCLAAARAATRTSTSVPSTALNKVRRTSLLMLRWLGCTGAASSTAIGDLARSPVVFAATSAAFFSAAAFAAAHMSAARIWMRSSTRLSVTGSSSAFRRAFSSTSLRSLSSASRRPLSFPSRCSCCRCLHLSLSREAHS